MRGIGDKLVKRKSTGVVGILFVGLVSSLLAMGQTARAQVSAPWVGRFMARRVVAAMSPDNNFEVLSSFLGSARRTIQIAVYEFESPQIEAVLERAMSHGVKVSMLLEGGLIPTRIPETELYLTSRLASRGAHIEFYDISKGRYTRRFRFFHNKYAIVDGIRVMVGSANYGNTGQPFDPTIGNREWETAIDDPHAAMLFERLFIHDASIPGEWVPYGKAPRYTLNDPSFRPSPSEPHGSYRMHMPPAIVDNVPGYTVFAPDNSLDPNGPLLGALRSVRSSLLVEQLELETYWGGKPYNPRVQASPVVSLIIAAARAGKMVRVLLNNPAVFYNPPHRVMLLGATIDSVFSRVFAFARNAVAGTNKGHGQNTVSSMNPNGPRDNQATVAYLDKIARAEHLNLAARLLDYRHCGFDVIHNKGMIVDGRLTLVGSINWAESSMKFNREADVLLESPRIAQYYTHAFAYDWNCSAAMAAGTK